jgi:hypothetical protein
MTRAKKIIICDRGHQVCASCMVTLNDNHVLNCPECRTPLNRVNFKVLHQKYLKH